jgi:hypothetical protein
MCASLLDKLRRQWNTNLRPQPEGRSLSQWRAIYKPLSHVWEVQDYLGAPVAKVKAVAGTRRDNWNVKVIVAAPELLSFIQHFANASVCPDEAAMKLAQFQENARAILATLPKELVNDRRTTE